MRIILVLLLTLCGFWAEAHTHVLVSVAPQKFLVESIGGKNVSVEVIVPAGASPHTYEPTPKQLVSNRKGEIWFRLGEGFEDRLMKVLGKALVVDQREGLELIRASCGCGGDDPHIWLSPRLLQQEAEQIFEVLAAYDPEHRDVFKGNFERLLKELEELDREVGMRLAGAPKTVLVSHPAFGYLCRDYGLSQLSIEMEGREPTPRYLTELIGKAQRLEIDTIYVQKQYSVKGAKRMASVLGARCIYLDPYAENVVENLKEIASAFSP